VSVAEIIDGMNFLVRSLFEIISREVREGVGAAGQRAVRAGRNPLLTMQHVGASRTMISV